WDVRCPRDEGRVGRPVGRHAVVVQRAVVELVARVEDERRVEGLVGRVVVDEVLVEELVAVLRVRDPEVLAVLVRVRGQGEGVGAPTPGAKSMSDCAFWAPPIWKMLKKLLFTRGPYPKQPKDSWISLRQMPVPHDVTSVGSHILPSVAPPAQVQVPKDGSWIWSRRPVNRLRMRW